MDWGSFYNFTDPEHCWDFIESKINNLIGEMCPLKHRTIKDRGDLWITNEIIELLHDTELAWNTAMDTQHQNEIAEAKRLSVKEICQKPILGDPKGISSKE